LNILLSQVAVQVETVTSHTGQVAVAVVVVIAVP
jgi:hypothetical protein